MTPAGLPHSDTPGSQLGCQLPRAYRRLQRPSSALDAKASTMCPSQLVSQTLNKNNKRHTPPPPTIKGGSRALQKDQTTTHIYPGRCQMLASTIHMSNTPPTNPHPHEQPHGTGKGGTEQPTHPPGAHPTGGPLRGTTGLIPQGPTACQDPTPTNHPPGSTRPTPNHKGSSQAAVLRTAVPRDAGIHR